STPKSPTPKHAVQAFGLFLSASDDLPNSSISLVAVLNTAQDRFRHPERGHSCPQQREWHESQRNFRGRGAFARCCGQECPRSGSAVRSDFVLLSVPIYRWSAGELYSAWQKDLA